MRMTIAWLIATLALLAAITSTASAATFSMTFEVTSLRSFNGSPPPTDPVLGTIIWDAPDIHSTVHSIDSINMTLGGHPYSPGEIGYLSQAGFNMIGGISEGVDMMLDSTDDFWISWDPNTLTPTDFAYTSALRSGMWHANGFPPGSFPVFSITQVPEPSPAALIGLAFLSSSALVLRRQLCGKILIR
jgi:hypothetical protein